MVCGRYIRIYLTRSDYRGECIGDIEDMTEGCLRYSVNNGAGQ